MTPAAVAPLVAALLAQLPKSNPPTPLPAPPFFERLLFEQPFGLATGFVLAAVVAFVALRRNGKPRPAAVTGGLCLILAIASYLASTWVVTQREQVSAATRALVAATAKADTASLDALLRADVRLHSRIRVPVQNVPDSGMDKEAILAAVSRTIGGSYPIKDFAVKEVQALIDGPGVGRTQVKVWIQLEMGVPNTSWWLIRWSRDTLIHGGGAGSWRATSIEPLDIPTFGSPN